MHEYSTSESPLRWALTSESFPIESEGMVRVPTAPRLGVSVNEVVIATNRV